MKIILYENHSGTLLRGAESEERIMTGSGTHPISPDTVRPLRRRAWVFFPGLLALAVSLILSGLPVQAQDNGLRPLVERLGRLERDINLLQRQVYTEGAKGVPGKVLKQAAPPATGNPTGVAGAGGTPSNLAVRVETRFTELEDELRKVTGQFEELTFKINQVQTRLDKLVGDIDFRLTTLEGATPQAYGGTPGAEGGGVAGPDGIIAGRSGEEGVLGILKVPVDKDGNPIEGAVASENVQDQQQDRQAEPQQALLPEGTPEEQYKYALGLLRQADYPMAEKSFRAFIAANGEHELVANAQYWLGETFYVRKDYTNAAVIFAEGYEKFADSPKAPDNLLKLGLSLANIDEQQQACKAFFELERRFINAPSVIMNRALKERKAIGCAE
ncbi:MAG: tol-pal system protein YbgF [Alphaproteobacteria bacterium]|nr:tol-pal system protein YbgF [Alphaproteobacteria bacterium]